MSRFYNALFRKQPFIISYRLTWGGQVYNRTQIEVWGVWNERMKGACFEAQWLAYWTSQKWGIYLWPAGNLATELVFITTLTTSVVVVVVVAIIHISRIYYWFFPFLSQTLILNTWTCRKTCNVTYRFALDAWSTANSVRPWFPLVNERCKGLKDHFTNSDWFLNTVNKKMLLIKT